MHLLLIGGPYFHCLIDGDEIYITYVTCTTQISKCSLHLYILNSTGETPDPMDLYLNVVDTSDPDSSTYKELGRFML